MFSRFPIPGLFLFVSFPLLNKATSFHLLSRKGWEFPLLWTLSRVSKSDLRGAV